jgi:hypothetical protein
MVRGGAPGAGKGGPKRGPLPYPATQGTSRDLRASRIESFLREALAGGEKTVVALQEKARAAGLLGERQTAPGPGSSSVTAHDSQPASPATCYLAGMAKLFGDDWPVSSRPAKLIICVIVFALGIAAGAAIAMWVMPPS